MREKQTNTQNCTKRGNWWWWDDVASGRITVGSVTWRRRYLRQEMNMWHDMKKEILLRIRARCRVFNSVKDVLKAMLERSPLVKDSSTPRFSPGCCTPANRGARRRGKSSGWRGPSGPYTSHPGTLTERPRSERGGPGKDRRERRDRGVYVEQVPLGGTRCTVHGWSVDPRSCRVVYARPEATARETYIEVGRRYTSTNGTDMEDGKIMRGMEAMLWPRSRPDSQRTSRWRWSRWRALKNYSFLELRIFIATMRKGIVRSRHGEKAKSIYERLRNFINKECMQ